MEKQFVTYEIALMLKEKGFDQPCFGSYYDEGKFSFWNWTVYKDYPYLTKNSVLINMIAAPLWQQVIDWLEREHWVDFWAVPILTPNPKQYECFIMYRGKEISCEILGIRFFNSYNDARQTAVEKILKHI
jgi:hypothetical protein